MGFGGWGLGGGVWGVGVLWEVGWASENRNRTTESAGPMAI